MTWLMVGRTYPDGPSESAHTNRQGPKTTVSRPDRRPSFRKPAESLVSSHSEDLCVPAGVSTSVQLTIS